MSEVGTYDAWRRQFNGRTEWEETELYEQQAREVVAAISREFEEDDDGQLLTDKQIGVRRRLVATLFRDVFDVRRRAVNGCVRGSGLQGDRDSEWCFPLEGNDSQIGELRHPVTVNGHGDTDIRGWQFRMYFAAPLVEPALILFLVFGRKPSSLVSDDWQAIQREHIEQARAEFSAWRAKRQLGNSLPRGNG